MIATGMLGAQEAALVLSIEEGSIMVELGFDSERTFAVGQSNVRKHTDATSKTLNVSQFGNETRLGSSEFQKSNKEAQAYALDFGKETMQKYNADIKEFDQKMVSLLDPIKITYQQKNPNS